MKLIEEIDTQKLRGGFYTPALVVDACLDRLKALLNGTKSARLLEPSAGDGAFVRGLARLRPGDPLRKSHCTCVELVESEGAACRSELRRGGLHGDVVVDSFFNWASANHATFHAVVGNPPFIRYQFVPESDRELAEWLLRTRGHELHGVSNYWIPFVLLSLDVLPPGGVFSLVLPSELLSTVSAGQVRSELIRNFHSIRLDLYPRQTFPDILQDVLILSGVRDDSRASSRTVIFSEHTKDGVREWQHQIDDSGESWTRFLLSTTEWDAFEAARKLPGFHRFRELATVSVAIVTGANDFFTVDEATLKRFGLEPWAKPLLARTAESPGIIFGKSDRDNALLAGKKCWLLDFAADKPDPALCSPAAKYLGMGVSGNLTKRFKCAIREPWYRVPHIQRGSLMMAKRSHQHHRLILNDAKVFTTDTIYRGEMTPAFREREIDVVAAFHNSVTMLSAEVEGRSYGGGVLELVPSEVARLSVPMVQTGKAVWRLDGVSRRTGGQKDADDSLIEATDEMLKARVPGLSELLPTIIAARLRLRDRRFFG